MIAHTRVKELGGQASFLKEFRLGVDCGLSRSEARDLNHAISLMSKHPGVKMGPFEIRPANEAVNRLIAERDAAIAKEA